MNSREEQVRQDISVLLRLKREYRYRTLEYVLDRLRDELACFEIHKTETKL